VFDPDERDKDGNVVPCYEDFGTKCRRQEIRDRLLLVPREQLCDVRVPDAVVEMIRDLANEWMQVCLARVNYLTNVIPEGTLSSRGTGVCYEPFENELYQSQITIIPITNQQFVPLGPSRTLLN
jgi:hypothetical protein